MIDKLNKVELEERSSDRFYNYLSKSAVFIAIVTASLYFIGYGFYKQFFERLTVPDRFLNIQMIDFMTASLGPILLMVAFFMIVGVIWTHAPRNRKEAFIGNLLIFIPFAIILIFFNLIV